MSLFSINIKENIQTNTQLHIDTNRTQESVNMPNGDRFHLVSLRLFGVTIYLLCQWQSCSVSFFLCALKLDNSIYILHTFEALYYPKYSLETHIKRHEYKLFLNYFALYLKHNVGLPAMNFNA